jgi:hypothetical protein
LIFSKLFARLGHPDRFVNNQLVYLITRISQESPHLVIYPVVASSSTNNHQSKQIHGKDIQPFVTIS